MVLAFLLSQAESVPDAAEAFPALDAVAIAAADAEGQTPLTAAPKAHSVPLESIEAPEQSV